MGFYIVMFAMVVGTAAIIAAKYRDTMRKTVAILYDFEPGVDESFRRFHEWAQAVSASRRAWHIAASGDVYDRKYHAGASAIVGAIRRCCAPRPRRSCARTCRC